MRVYPRALAVLLALAITPHVRSADTSRKGAPSALSRSDPANPPSCGATALTLLCRLEGLRPDLSAVAARLPSGSDESCALSELRAAAKALCLPTRAVRLGRGDWPLDRPALIHLARGPKGHFVVIRPVGHTGKLVQVLDGLDQVEVTDFDRLVDRPSWTGAALVPTRRDRWVRDRVILGLTLLAGPLALWWSLRASSKRERRGGTTLNE